MALGLMERSDLDPDPETSIILVNHSPSSIVALTLSPYFCDIAAPGGSCAAHARAEQPSVALPVPSGPHRLVEAQSAGSDRSPAHWMPSEIACRHTR